MNKYNRMKNQFAPNEFVEEELRRKIMNTSVKKKTPLFRYAASFVLLAIAATVAVLLWKQPGKIKPTSELSNDISKAEIAYVKKWNERNNAEKFGGVTINGKEYYVNANENTVAIKGEKIGEGNVSGTDIYTGKTYSASFEAYKIESVSDECALLIKYEGEEKYYVCRSSSYSVSTLGELISDMSLRKNMTFEKIEFEDGSVYSADSDAIWNMLLSNADAENAGSEKYVNALASVGVLVPTIGIKTPLSLGVNENGYLQTNLVDTGCAFYIGKDKVEEFIDYVKENCTLLKEKNTEQSPLNDGEGDASKEVTVETTPPWSPDWN